MVLLLFGSKMMVPSSMLVFVDAAQNARRARIPQRGRIAVMVALI